MPKKLHGLLSEIDFVLSDAALRQKAFKYFKSRNFDKDSYIDLLSGNYHDSFYDQDLKAALELLKDSKHNTPENNEKIVENLIDKHDKSQYKSHCGLLVNEAIKSMPLNEEYITDLLGRHAELSKKHVNVHEVVNNPSFNGSHLEAISRKPAMQLSSELLKHKNMTKEIFKKILKNKNWENDKLPGVTQHRYLDKEDAKQILENSHFNSGHDLHNLLTHLTPDEKKTYIDERLGIAGGKNEREKDDDSYDEDSFGWDNWNYGLKRNDETARTLSQSEHLGPSQIEHIKRHGTFDDRWNLFHNEHIDPKHAIEMLSKWDADHNGHGYDRDDFKEKMKKEHKYSKWDDFIDEAREKAQENYSIEDYLKNWDDEDKSQAYFDKSYKDWKTDWITENMDPAGDNPDYNPQGYHPPAEGQAALPGMEEGDRTDENPKQVHFWGPESTFSDDDPENHPKYSDYEEKAEEAFEEALKEADTPDRVYEGYDESIQDDLSREIDKLFHNAMDNITASEAYLPKHVVKAIQAPWKDENNPTPEEIDKGLDHPLEMVRRTAARAKNLSPDSITKVLAGKDDDLKSIVLKHNNVTPEHLEPILSSPDDYDDATVRLAAQHYKATPEQLIQFIGKNLAGEKKLNWAMSNPTANESHAKQIIHGYQHGSEAEKHAYPIESELASLVYDNRFNLDNADVAKGIASNDRNMIAAAIGHHAASKDQVLAAAGSEHGNVKRKAKDISDKRFPPTADPVSVKLGTHPLRQMRDVVENLGGVVKKGKLKELGVNTAPIDKLFKPNGTIAAADIQQHIDSIPASQYNSSHGEWDGGQRHSDSKQPVFQLNYTEDQLHQMEKAGVLGTFQRIQDASHNSGHPVKRNTLGWVRYTGNPEKGFHIDEIQSDFGQSMIRRVAQQAKEALRAGSIDESDAETAMSRAKEYYPEDHVEKITEILFGKTHPSEMLHEGFKEYMRQKGFGNTPIHIWQPQSKAPISGQLTEIELHPDKIDSSIDELKSGKGNGSDHKAIVAWGQKNKLLPSRFADIQAEHLEGLRLPLKDAEAKYSSTSGQMMKLSVPLPVHMQEGYGAIPKKMKYSEGTYGEIKTQENPDHKGQATYKDIIRKTEIDSQTRTKVAMTLKTIKDNQQVFKQLQQANPQAYEALMATVKALTDIFKAKTGEEPEALIHELEIEEQLEQQQQQMQESGQSSQTSDQPPPNPEESFVPNKDERLHGKKMVYSTGSIRNYTPQDERIKDEYGNWNSFKGGIQESTGDSDDPT